MKKHSELVVRSGDVLGKEVVNAKGESLGSIDDIVLDKFSGQVKYVVLSFGGIFGLGDKLFALPWASISYDTDVEAFVLNIADIKERLKQAPGFDKDHWPDMQQPVWQESIAAYYR